MQAMESSQSDQYLLSGTALVTGASGFIGSTLVERLLSNGVKVRALLQDLRDAENLNGLSCERVKGDLNDLESLKKAVKGVDYVFHLAGTLFSTHSEGYFKGNVTGTQNLAEAISLTDQKIKRMIFVSSLAAGGPAPESSQKNEDEPSVPVSNYGRSKLQAELTLSKYFSKIPVTIIRPPMVYGPKDRGLLVVFKPLSKFLMPLLRGRSADRKKYFSAIYSEDLCNGLILAAKNDALPSGELFYLSDDRVYSFETILQSIANGLGIKPIRIVIPESLLSMYIRGLSYVSFFTGKTFSLNEDKMNELRPDYWTCSNSKAKNQLGFVPAVELEQGMKKTVHWYKEKGWI
jgi:dihydroflavonol-4-reductase